MLLALAATSHTNWRYDKNASCLGWPGHDKHTSAVRGFVHKTARRDSPAPFLALGVVSLWAHTPPTPYSCHIPDHASHTHPESCSTVRGRCYCRHSPAYPHRYFPRSCLLRLLSTARCTLLRSCICSPAPGFLIALVEFVPSSAAHLRRLTRSSLSLSWVYWV